MTYHLYIYSTFYQLKKKINNNLKKKILVPTYNPHYASSRLSHNQHSPPPGVYLCQGCSTYLAHSLYFIPSRHNIYLRETSTRSFLRLVDDAVQSLESQIEMEKIGIEELDMIIRAELAVIDWRMAVKLARMNMITGVLDIFPVNLGEFADFKAITGSGQKREGFLKRVSKKALTALGVTAGSTGANVASGPNLTEEDQQ